jgi:signal transduction histidine kinase
MKLASHYNKVSIIITVSVLFVGAIIYFFTINYIGKSQLDRNLVEEINGINNYIKVYQKLPKQVDFDEDKVEFVKTSRQYLTNRFFDTVYINPKEKEQQAGRAVSCLIKLNGENYFTTITLSREDTENLIQIIGLITLGLTVGLLLILFLANRYLLNGLWKPFYMTLIKLRSFNIYDKDELHFSNTRVDEFNELNDTVQTMSSKVKSDFLRLKQFTENASHEMQTPLAVITSKLDTLIQDESLKPDLYDQVNDIYAATGKLSRLNQSLLLIVKIENNLIEDVEELRLDILITEKIKQFHELLIDNGIEVISGIAEKQIVGSKYLVEILLNNLFSNAIRHNTKNGHIIIRLNNRELIFQNDGQPEPLNADQVFERFQKGKKSEGTGLGLALIKNICTKYGWQVTYFYSNALHGFRISFGKER